MNRYDMARAVLNSEHTDGRTRDNAQKVILADSIGIQVNRGVIEQVRNSYIKMAHNGKIIPV